MQPSLLQLDPVIFDEMMSHPVLFAHHHPHSVAIISHKETGIVSEVLKHPAIKKIYYVNKDAQKTMPNEKVQYCNTLEEIDLQSNALDVVITLAESTPELLQHYFKLLHQDGILLQLGNSPFDLPAFKLLLQQVQIAGFSDLQILNFPQQTFPSGWRMALMAQKKGVFKRVREKDVFNKLFKTQYYNFDIHKAAMVLPEFMREEWVI